MSQGLKIWGASSKGRGQKSGGRSKDGAKIQRGVLRLSKLNLTWLFSRDFWGKFRSECLLEQDA